MIADWQSRRAPLSGDGQSELSQCLSRPRAGVELPASSRRAVLLGHAHLLARAGRSCQQLDPTHRSRRHKVIRAGRRGLMFSVCQS